MSTETEVYIFEDEVLFNAAKKNNKSLFDEFYEQRSQKKEFNPNIIDSLGNSPIHYSATFGHLEITKELFKLGANANIQNKAGDTPLHKAVWYDKSVMAELLIENGADPTLLNNQKQSASNFAKTAQLKELLKQATLARSINKEDFADDSDDEEDDAAASKKPYKPTAHDHSDMVADDDDE